MNIFATLLIISLCRPISHEVETFFTVDIPAQQMILKTEGFSFNGSAVFDPNSNIETKDWTITNLSFGEIKLIVKDANILDWLIATQIQINITDNHTQESLTHFISGNHSLYPSNTILISTTESEDEFLSNLIIKKHSATFEISGLTNQSGAELVFTYSIRAFASLDR
ncbi:MAG: hypothetical protein JW857_01450 [Bacteroidales bacterium]|nr:hypothetical protein [Bacteroidales bacterium]